ncbi:MAG TPA: hypothetical protein VHV31_01470, partial [Nitrolancea sp.]|nr:hypothetical protein [Nitrolancea sp.]
APPLRYGGTCSTNDYENRYSLLTLLACGVLATGVAVELPANRASVANGAPFCPTGGSLAPV